MCLLACWIDSHPLAPIVVAANRDERARPSREPFVWDGSPRIVAPQDEVAGGSWWAVNEAGIFVGLTNRMGATVDASRRSRGQLVIDAARAGGIAELEELLRALRAADYNGFHLLATDGRTGILAVDDAEQLAVSRIGSGLHVISERSFGVSATARDESARERLQGSPSVEELQRTLAIHSPLPFQGMCLHLPGIDYGTRSSTVLALGGEKPLLHFAPGPPCVTEWKDLSGLLEPGRRT